MSNTVLKLPVFFGRTVETVIHNPQSPPIKHCESCKCQIGEDYRQMGITAASWFGTSVPYLFLEALWLELGRKYYIHRMK